MDCFVACAPRNDEFDPDNTRVNVVDASANTEL